jgi:2-succinyl-5-enolpyruvyl-6-hydroxy-3-cyclohexene-1-carboxylate synthase
VIVLNDDGGAIFAGLEPGAPAHAGSFERVFATPTGADLSALCAAHGLRHRRVADERSLNRALAEAPHGIEVIEVTMSRVDRRHVDRRLSDAVARTWEQTP